MQNQKKQHSPNIINGQEQILASDNIITTHQIVDDTNRCTTIKYLPVMQGHYPRKNLLTIVFKNIVPNSLFYSSFLYIFLTHLAQGAMSYDINTNRLPTPLLFWHSTFGCI
jgi:hypothetical protein